MVFPAPAGAIASCSRAPELHIRRTSEACPASSAVPFAAISSRARSTAVGSIDAPPYVPPPRQDGPRRRGSAARCTGRRRRRYRPTTRRPAATPPAPRCRRAARPGQQTGDRAPHRPAGPPAPRMFCGHAGGADLSLCFGPDMPHLPGRSARLHYGQDVISRLCDPLGVGDRSGLGVPVPAPSAPSTRRLRVRPTPSRPR